MEATGKYRKERESYVPYQVHYNRIFKYHLSHERFVVPWQMEDIKPVKEKDKD